MADKNGATGTHSSNTSSDNPNHLNTNIESGTFDEKQVHQDDAEKQAAPPKPAEEEEEDEDMDALIDELESQDGHAEEEEGEAEATPGGGRVVPEDQLQTDTRIGLTDAEVHARRKKYGMNQMKEEKENLFLKFLGYFIGPIQFVMEVRFLNLLARPSIPVSGAICQLYPHVSPRHPRWPARSHIFTPQFRGAKTREFLRVSRAKNIVCDRLLLFLLQVSRIGSISVSSARCFCSTPLSVSSKNSKLVPLWTN